MAHVSTWVPLFPLKYHPSTLLPSLFSLKMKVDVRSDPGLISTTPVQHQPETPPSVTTGGGSHCHDEERRRRRMMSNRESARRSRMRKRKHKEEMELKADRLESENRELRNRIFNVDQCCVLLNGDNYRLRLEQAYLRRRLSEARQVLAVQQLHGVSAACGNDVVNVDLILTGNVDQNVLYT